MSAESPVQRVLPVGSASYATGVWTCLIGITALILSRRLAGALTRDLSLPVVCTVTGAAALLSLMAYSVHTRGRLRNTSAGGRIAAGIVTLVPPFGLGIAILPAESSAGVWYLIPLFLFAGLLMMILGDASGSVRSKTLHSKTDDSSRQQSELCVIEQSAAAPRGYPASSGTRWAAAKSATESEIELAGPAEQHEPLLDEGTHYADRGLESANRPREASQWITRSTRAGGADCIAGELQVEIVAGQKQATIHVPFSPSLSGQPTVSCETVGDAPVRLRVAAVHTYGIRIEARRTVALAAETVTIKFQAVAPAAQQRAA